MSKAFVSLLQFQSKKVAQVVKQVNDVYLLVYIHSLHNVANHSFLDNFTKCDTK